MFYHARTKCLEKNKMVQCMGNVHGVKQTLKLSFDGSIL